MLLILQSLTRNTAMEIAVNVKALHNETESLLVGRVPLVRSQSTWFYSFIQIIHDLFFADFCKLMPK